MKQRGTGIDYNPHIKVLLIEPPGGFIRLDRCMQSIDSWGGVYRFPLNLARIGAAINSYDFMNIEKRFIDLQADPNTNLEKTLLEFKPNICILSCGFPSMRHDAETASFIKRLLPETHVSTFGVVPTLLKGDFFKEETWGFPISFDSIVVGGEPALAYDKIICGDKIQAASVVRIIESEQEKKKGVHTLKGRSLFDHALYRSPFTGDMQTYIEGSYGCPKECNFCVVPQLYDGNFSRRSVEDILLEFKFVITKNNVKQISLWDEGTTFQRTQIKELCEGLIELRKSNVPALQNFTWNTRSTTALIDEEIVSLMKQSGLTGITLGIESFDKKVLRSTGKGTTIHDNEKAIRVLKQEGIISIGHIVLGLPEETRESAETTIAGAINSGLDIAQFYCAIPYPGTPLYEQASKEGLIKVQDLTKYELCNPIMDTLGGLTHLEVGDLRRNAMQRFYESKKNLNVHMLRSDNFANWSKR